MKKVIVNMSDSEYEKLAFEAVHRLKSVSQVVKDRLFERPFHPDILEAYEFRMNEEFQKLMKD